MKIKTIPSKWLESEGRRLDCGPYMSGAIEAKELLKKHKTEPLHTLTFGHNGGIFNGPRFPRIYVDDPACGVPFLGSTDILHADLSNIHLLSKKLVEVNPALVLDDGWTLITCSGTIGRMVYARSDMKGMAGSQHFMRVSPDVDKIKPGYLFAYLSSRFGVPIVVSGTYGAIIQHIEPHHIADLPVPRLEDVEERAHELVQKAADELSEHAALMNLATTMLLSEAGLEESLNYKYLSDTRRLGWAERNSNSCFLRALNYDPRAKELWGAAISINHDLLGDIVHRENFEGYIVFTRIDCESEFGSLLIGQREAFSLRPKGRWISKKSIDGLGLIVPPRTTVIPCQGTLGESEVYCRAVYVTPRNSDYAYSGHFYRCIPKEDVIAPGYLYAFMRSRFVFRLLRSISIGSKQQYQHPKMMTKIPIPRLDAKAEQAIAEKVDRAAYLRDHAIDLEDEARAIVERAIEEGGR
ncbi:MAG: restriction endonuclease subunit S [bacterium]|nr:restriction endonuclease subunit S [bacterium]